MRDRFNVIEKRNIFFIASGVIILIGILSMIFQGLNQDVEFVGGTAVQVAMGKDFNEDDIRTLVNDTVGFEASSVQKSDETDLIIKTKELDNEQRISLVEALKEKYELEQSAILSVDNFSAAVGNELRYQAILSSIITAILMLIYITFRFEFKSGVAAVISLVHNILVMMTVYTVFRIPVNTSFIAAILTILGYSINDTIVIFDRIRENKKLARKETFSSVANKSIWQSIARSINTSVTTLLTITMLYLLGVQSIKEFSFPIIIGILSGTYSSIFIASPIWAMWVESEKKDKKRAAAY